MESEVTGLSETLGQVCLHWVTESALLTKFILLLFYLPSRKLSNSCIGGYI